MCGHLLGNLQSSTIPEIGSDAGGAEGMTADLGLDPGLGSSPANHPPHIGLQQGTVASSPPRPLLVRKSGPFSVLGDAGGGDVFLQVAVQIVVRGHLVFLAALLMQPHPTLPPLHKEVLHLHEDRSSDPGKGIDHLAINARSRRPGREVVSIASIKVRAALLH